MASPAWKKKRKGKSVGVLDVLVALLIAHSLLCWMPDSVLRIPCCFCFYSPLTFFSFVSTLKNKKVSVSSSFRIKRKQTPRYHGKTPAVKQKYSMKRYLRLVDILLSVLILATEVYICNDMKITEELKHLFRKIMHHLGMVHRRKDFCSWCEWCHSLGRRFIPGS